MDTKYLCSDLEWLEYLPSGTKCEPNRARNEELVQYSTFTEV